MVVDPTVVITDFQQAMLNTLQNISSFDGMLFITYVRTLGNTSRDAAIKLWCVMLDALEFLLENEVATGIQASREYGFDDLVSYFNSTYVWYF